MSNIALSLESQQTPSPIGINWIPLADRSVLALEGGTAGDLDFRFRLNAVLRSTRKATAKKAVLRGSKKATLSFQNTRLVPTADLEALLEAISDDQRTLRIQIVQLYKRYGKTVPSRYFGDLDEGSVLPDGFEMLDQMVSASDKKSLKYISAMQELEKVLAQKEEQWHRNVLTRALAEKTLTNATATMEARNAKLIAELNQSVPRPTDEESARRQKEVFSTAPVPKIMPSVVGIEVHYSSSMDILHQDFDRLASFIERHPEETRWVAPQEARDTEGRLLPLSQKCEAICRKNLTIKGPISKLTKEEKEALAWRWLIISHNHVNKADKVTLPPKLSISYERNVGQSKPASSHALTEASLAKVMEEFRKSIATPNPTPITREPMVPLKEVEAFAATVWEATKAQLHFGCDAVGGSRFQPKVGKEKAYHDQCVRWNKVLDAADTLMEHHKLSYPTVEDFLPSELDRHVDDFIVNYTSSTVGEESQQETYPDEEWLSNHPEFIERDGVTFFRSDIEILDVSEGQEFRTVVHNGEQYYCVQGTPAGPAKGIKARGKTPARPHSPPAKPKESGKSEKPKGSPLKEENPLKVKGEAKSKALSDGQRETLRTYFKLKQERVPSDVWNSLDNKGRKQAMAERSIPRWASEAVLRSANNLQLIVEGKLTKENAQTAPRSPKASVAKPTAQAMEAWQQLKADFKGTPLYRSPVTAKEKAFKKRFDQLVASYGEQPCFPKLRERPDQQGRSSSRGGTSQGAGRQGQGGDFLEMAKAFGEIARAFSGRSN
jgi:hypothetical protein